MAGLCVRACARVRVCACTMSEEAAIPGAQAAIGVCMGGGCLLLGAHVHGVH